MHAVITSTTNPRIKAIRKLHQSKHRRREGRTLVEGPNGCEALVRTQTIPTDFLALETDTASHDAAAALGVTPLIVSPAVMDAASDAQHSPGPVAVIATPPWNELRAHRSVCLCDVADPGNVGAIIRTAVAFGWDVVVSGSTADPWGPKAMRSAAAATLDARLSMVADPVGDARSAGLTTVALTTTGEVFDDGGGDAVMLLVGSEAHGLPDHVVAGADREATIPAHGVESLNAAAAAAIAIYAMSR